MAIRHKKVSARTDGTDATKIQPVADWNDDHNHVPFPVLTVAPASALLTWTDMPSALTEFLGLTRAHRLQADLTYATQARLVVQVSTAGFSGSGLRAQYWDGAAWQYLDGGTGPEAILTSTGDIASGWVTLAAGAKQDRVLRLVGINGNGVVDPVFGMAQLQVR